MNKNELIEAVVAKTNFSKAQAARTVTALTETITEVLQRGDSISLPGFDTFEVRERGERSGRNPKTGEQLKISASKVPAFKPGSTLKAAVNHS
ncbi:DNA-binding protein HU-beta [Nitrosospira multiformis]|uniref:DNA-binding protein HU-beta n=1 Tax=Nitrosospira multiformis TaxID=1231 RepID=A0A1H8Q7W5_9PROT|nr:HU family DNA-binding protein [Nitrosospira multiformis]SEO50315.1 DNA-binding protein HU-beta [Nitrosospira multiformis]